MIIKNNFNSIISHNKRLYSDVVVSYTDNLSNLGKVSTTKTISVKIPLSVLSEVEFINLLMLNLKLNTTNTVLFKYVHYSSMTNLMLGGQVGIIVKDIHDISYYKSLYLYFQSKLEYILSLYNIDSPDFIIIYFKEINFTERLKSIENVFSKNNKINLPIHLIKGESIKTKFNNSILPLTLDESHYGHLLLDQLRNDYLNNIISKLNVNLLAENNNIKILDLINLDLNIQIIEKYLLSENIQLLFLMLVIKLEIFRVFLSNNKKYLIITINNSKFNFYRFVFSIDSAKLIFICKDSLINNTQSLTNSNLLLVDIDFGKYFIREIGKFSVILNDHNDIEFLIKSIELPPIKYIDYKKHNVFKDIKTKLPVVNRNNKFGVFDLETFDDINSQGDKFSRVFALGFMTFSGEKKLFYLTDEYDNSIDSSTKLVLKCIDTMLKTSYHNYIFYVHNLGRFDSVFLIKILLDRNLSLDIENKYKIIPLYRDSKMLRLVIKKKLNTKNIKISFVDSLNLLNNSLDKLCKDFNVSIQKGVFPYSFVNKDNLNYIGNTPSIYYYNNKIDIDLYNNSVSNNWSLRDETLKYLERDLSSLLEILKIFQNHLWLDHNIEMTESLTISSLALNKYLKHYLKDSKIPLITDFTIFQFILNSYFGGITEVYRPYGRDLIFLDVNSLYPSAALNDMPGLECKWIESYNKKGLKLEELFGVFEAEVETNNLYIGLLPVKTKMGLIFPNGKFKGIWTSIELQFAKKHGYKIKVLKGLNFNKIGSSFKDYIQELSIQKDLSTGSNRQVVKSLLNNLIGRFGLNFLKPITKIVTKEDFDYIAATREIKSFNIINDDSFMVTYFPLVDKNICNNYNLDYYKVILNENKKENIFTSKIDIFKDVSIVIASFVTAYARIHMHDIKLNILKAEGKLYYSDTDSIVTNLTVDDLNVLLPGKIGNKLGQLKLEHLVEEGYFISNKTYAILIKENKLIIKAKGISSDSIALTDYKDMYYNSKYIEAYKNYTNINHSNGFVTIEKKKVYVDWNSFTKRTKIYNNNLWVDTFPIYIDNLTKDIDLYKPKNIIIYIKK